MILKLPGNECGSWVEKAEVFKRKRITSRMKTSWSALPYHPKTIYSGLVSIPHHQTSLGNNIWHQICPLAPSPEFCHGIISSVSLCGLHIQEHVMEAADPREWSKS